MSRPGPDRRDALKIAGGATAAAALASEASAQAPTPSSTPGRLPANADTRSIGARLQGVQHVGITVEDLARAHAFYVEVLGGTEIMSDGDFQGDRIQNTLFQKEELDAETWGVKPASIGVPDLRAGSQRLDVRFVRFDNVVIELLQYREAAQPQGARGAFAPARRETSPAYPQSIHLSFHVWDDVDFDQFIRDVEAEALRRGMMNVKANRVVRVTSEGERAAAPLDASTNKITEGPSDGWALAYLKGPEGEQLEFNQVIGQAKRVFDGARDRRDRAIAAR